MKLGKVALWIGCLLVGGCEFHASCNAGKTLDMKNGEVVVKKMMAARTGSEPSAVSCPGKVKIEKGGRFDCQITIDGVKGVVTMEQQDDKTNVEIVSVTGMVISQMSESTLAERLGAQSGKKVTVDCGPRVRASTPGESFRCHATDDAGVSLDVVIKVKDTAASYDWEVDKESIRGVAPPPAEAPPEEAPPAQP